MIRVVDTADSLWSGQDTQGSGADNPLISGWRRPELELARSGFPIAQPGLFDKSWGWNLVRSTRHGVRDAQLQRPQLEGHDSCIRIPFLSGMSDPAQSPPDHHVACGTDAGTGIDIPELQDIPLALQVVTGSQGALMKQKSRFNGVTTWAFFKGGG